MANKKVSQLLSKPSVLVTDLFPIADPTTGQLFKTTISDLGTAIGSGVSSVNTLVGAVVLDTDDIQELVSPTNKWFTDTRARAAISGGTGISYNSGTGVITNAVTSGQIATALGYTPADGANYLPLAGGTMGGAIFGTIATFASSTSVTALGITLSGATGDGVKITHSAGRAFNIQSSGSGFGILINNETASTSAPFTIQKQGLDKITFTDGGAGTFSGLLSGVNASFTSSGSADTVGINHSSGSGIALNITKGGNGEGIYVNKSSGSGNAVTIVGTLNATTLVKNGGTSSQFLKADGSVDSSTYALDSDVVKLTGNQTINGVKTFDAAVIINSSLNIVSGFYSIINNPGNTAYWQTYVDSSNLFIFGYQGTTPKVTINSSGNLTANSFIKSGGTSSQFLKADGSIDSTAYLPLSGGTLTGALNGTSSVFTSSITASALYVTGMTSGSGALYYNSGANRVTVANYNTNGIVVFEVNGGAAALTLNANLSSRFESNVGIGVTTSAWNTPFKALQLGTTTAVWDISSVSGFSNNLYNDGTSRYLTSNFSTIFQQWDGGFAWLQAPSGTAGNAISFTQAMTLDSSGRLALGRTSADHRLDVQGNILFRNTLANASFYLAQEVDNSSTLYQYANGTLKNVIASNAKSYFTGGNVGIGSSTADVPFEIHAGRTTDPPSLGAKGGTIAMLFNDSANGSYGLLMGLAGANVYLQNQRTDGDATAYNLLLQPRGGNVGIGTTSPSTKLAVAGKISFAAFETDEDIFGMYTASSGVTLSSSGASNLLFRTNATERMRITSGGKVIYNTTSNLNTLLGNNTKHYIVGDGNTNAAASHGSLFVAAGTSLGDSGISVNQGTSGMTMLLLASINTGIGTETNTAMYVVRFYFDGNNTPTSTYIGGSSDFVTFGKSGSNTLTLSGSSSGNKSYAWFVNKYGDS
jgi:hypothetical protein